MLQANPNADAERRQGDPAGTPRRGIPNYDPLTQGAGFLNAIGAVRLARFYATAQPGDRCRSQQMWSQHIIWGNHLLGQRPDRPERQRVRPGHRRGASPRPTSATTSCGAPCARSATTSCGAPRADGDNIVWGTSRRRRQHRLGHRGRWRQHRVGHRLRRRRLRQHRVGHRRDGDNIVWGTAAEATTSCGAPAADGDNIVWGTAAEGDNIVWGTAADGGDNIVWGTSADGDNIVWGTAADGDNIVWGTSADGDNIVWGTAADGDNIVWGTASSVSDVWIASTTDGTQTHLSGAEVFDRLKDRQLLKLLDVRAAAGCAAATAATAAGSAATAVRSASAAG